MGMMPQYPQQMMPMQQQMMMNGQMGYTPGMAMQNLGYNYQLPTLGYSMQSSWSPWDIVRLGSTLLMPGAQPCSRYTTRALDV